MAGAEGLEEDFGNLATFSNFFQNPMLRQKSSIPYILYFPIMSYSFVTLKDK